MGNTFTDLIAKTSRRSTTCIAGLVMIAGLMSGQQSYTFTNCGATGQFGPSQGQVNAAYGSGNPLSGQVTITGQGIQNWTVPGTGSYKILAVGASGGAAGSYNHFGRGASMEGEFILTGGTVLKIIVGQEGQQGTNGGCGGGGTFVADNNNTALIVAGGGSGGGNYAGPVYSIMDARVNNYGANYQSTGRATAGGGGGSFLVSGLNANGGSSFIAGGAGGGGSNGVGGFGGGAGSGGANQYAAGGGGYSGGDEISGTAVYQANEGGGGSYNSGINQVNAGGVNTGHGYVIITSLCDVKAFATQNPICIGSAVTLSTNAGSSIQWNTGPTTQSILVSPQTTTSYTVSGVSSSTSACINTIVVTVTVNALPVVSAAVFPSVTCVGGGATLSASGASTYVWNGSSPGQTVSVVPQATGDYTVAGTDFNGCTNTTVVNVMVDPISLSVTPSFTMCQGTSRMISASGGVTANSYTWSTGVTFPAIIVSPNNTSTYFVQGLDVHNCVLTANITASVVAKPDVAAGPDRDPICRGEMVNLIADGAQSYEWSDGSTTPTVSRILLADVTYTFAVTGTDANGCSNTATASVEAQKCLSLDSQDSGDLSIMPNPSSGQFRLDMTQENNYRFIVTDVTGKVVLEGAFTGKQHEIDMNGLSSGVYYLRVSGGIKNYAEKLIIQR